MKHRESEIQQACVRWFYYQYPNYAKALIKIPNEGKRSLRLGHISKMEGLQPGTPDLFLAVPKGRGGNYNGLFIEMKSETGRIAESQKTMLHYLSTMGYKTAVIRSITEFIKLITEYLGE